MSDREITVPAPGVAVPYLNGVSTYRTEIVGLAIEGDRVSLLIGDRRGALTLDVESRAHLVALLGGTTPETGQ